MKISTLILVLPPVQLLFSFQSNEDAEELPEGNGVKLDPSIVKTQTHKHLYTGKQNTYTHICKCIKNTKDGKLDPDIVNTLTNTYRQTHVYTYTSFLKYKQKHKRYEGMRTDMDNIDPDTQLFSQP